jgi:hypothetical protein
VHIPADELGPRLHQQAVATEVRPAPEAAWLQPIVHTRGARGSWLEPEAESPAPGTAGRAELLPGHVLALPGIASRLPVATLRITHPGTNATAARVAVLADGGHDPRSARRMPEAEAESLTFALDAGTPVAILRAADGLELRALRLPPAFAQLAEGDHAPLPFVRTLDGTGHELDWSRTSRGLLAVVGADAIVRFD